MQVYTHARLHDLTTAVEGLRKDEREAGVLGFEPKKQAPCEIAAALFPRCNTLGICELHKNFASLRLADIAAASPTFAEELQKRLPVLGNVANENQNQLA